jgi:L-lysine 2,3-aminomutase
VITHFNHPREITAKSVEAIKLLLDANVSLNNQAVLLKDVNDNADVLAQLFNKLIEVEIFPYYLFQCRPVKRVKKHFQVPLKDGYYIFENAKKRIKAHILCKRLKYIMSHRTGKIEIIGILEDKIYFKYHQAKNPKDLGKFFSKKLNSTAAWLDDLK